MKRLLLAAGLCTLIFGACSEKKETSADERIAIPYPLEEWKGTQGKTLESSEPYFIQKKQAPENAPNVMIIMLDDAGACFF